MNEPTAPNRDVRIAQLTETFGKLMNALGEKTEAAAAAKSAADKAKVAAETAVAETAALEDELTQLFSELETDAERFAGACSGRARAVGRPNAGMALWVLGLASHFSHWPARRGRARAFAAAACVANAAAAIERIAFWL